MISSDLLSSGSPSTYVRYVRVTWFVLKHSNVLPLFEHLSVECPGTRSPGVTHVSDEMVYSSTEADVQLMFQAEDGFAKSPNKPSSFHSASFHSSAHLLLQ